MAAKKPAKHPSLVRAEAELALARKAASKGIFKKPNWEEAATHYRESVKHYRMAGDEYLADRIVALRESAKANKENGSLNSAAVDLEKAAMDAKDTKDSGLAATLYKESANYYRANGQPDKGATMLVAAAGLIDDVAVALALFNDACTIFEEEKRGAYAEETFNKAILYALKNDRFAEALGFLSRQNVLFEQHMDTFAESLYKNFLQQMVIRFAQQDYKAAEEGFKEAEAKQADFGGTEHHGCCMGLLLALESGNPEELKNEVAKGTYKYLNNQVARLAKKLELSAAAIAAAGDKKRDESKAAPGEGVDDGSDDKGTLA